MGASSSLPSTGLLAAAMAVLLSVVAVQVDGATRHYTFDLQMASVTRLCGTKGIVTLNGQFPGPEVFAREGDRVVVRVVNHVPYNVTVHWHRIQQLRSRWADGPAYVTQRPIQPGSSHYARTPHQ